MMTLASDLDKDYVLSYFPPLSFTQWEPWNIFIKHFSFWQHLQQSLIKSLTLTYLLRKIIWPIWCHHDNFGQIFQKGYMTNVTCIFIFCRFSLNNIFGNLDDWFASNLKRQKFLLAYRDSFVSLEANCGLGSGHSPLTFPTSASVHAWGSALCP